MTATGVDERMSIIEIFQLNVRRALRMQATLSQVMDSCDILLRDVRLTHGNESERADLYIDLVVENPRAHDMLVYYSKDKERELSYAEMANALTDRLMKMLNNAGIWYRTVEDDTDMYSEYLRRTGVDALDEAVTDCEEALRVLRGLRKTYDERLELMLPALHTIASGGRLW